MCAVLSDVDVPAPRGAVAQPPRYRALGPAHLDRIAARYGLAGDQAATVRLHARVLPFRVNDLLRLLEQVVVTRRTVAVMAHFGHPRELSTAPCRPRWAGSGPPGR